MPDFIYPITKYCSLKILVVLAAMALLLGGLVALLVFVSRSQGDHNDLQYSMAEPVKNSHQTLYFPFGHEDMTENSTYILPGPDLKCRKGYFLCNASMTCLELPRRCNGVVECPNAEDELNCMCAFRMPPAKFCDKYPDCFDESDENFCSYCPAHSFNCGDGRCIPRKNVCDSVIHCDNAMDESFCFRLSSGIALASADDQVRADSSPKTGFLLKNQNGVWYPVCASRYDSMQDILASYACVSITANPLVATTHQQRHFVNSPRVASRDFLYYISGRFVQWSGCLTEEGIFIACDDVLCGFNPKLLLPRPRRARIVGGELSSPGAWPWHAAIYKNGTYDCGATLINNYWLLSASHCFLSHQAYYEIQLGMLRRRSFTPHQKTYQVERIVTYPKFNIVTLDYDIALVKTTEPIPFDFWVRPICLPDPGKVENVGAYCTAIGWGNTGESDDDSDDLQEVHIPLTPSCRNSDRWMCAGYPEGGRDACQGDSGGPLMCLQEDGLSWYVAGIISSGTGCARPHSPGMYTRVAFFVDWIKDVLRSPASPGESPLPSCPGWRCAVVGGGSCLPPEKLCDGHVDCYDAQDEVNCFKGKKRRQP